MKQLERKSETTYRWWRDDEKDILENDLEELDNSALSRINEMRIEGYTSGELLEEINGIQYSGWWETSTKTL